MDITLDTYPYGGGTTPIESLIQGVPVIGLIGERFCSKHAYNNMGNTGHGELIAHSKAEFVDKAVALASDRERLLRYRENLRNDVAHSRRADMERFITELEDAYSAMCAA